MRYLRLLLFVIIANCAFAQNNISQQVLDKIDSPYNLFNEDENGNIEYKGEMRHNISLDEIKNHITLWMYDEKTEKDISFDDLFDLNTILKCEVEIPVGKELFETPVGFFPRTKSNVTCKLEIKYNDSIMTYRLYNFYTNRRMIRGEAKSEGQSNAIHWQRINSLQKEKLEYEGKNGRRAKENYDEIVRLIEDEMKQYQDEYDTVTLFMERLKQCLSTK